MKDFTILAYADSDGHVSPLIEKQEPFCMVGNRLVPVLAHANKDNTITEVRPEEHERLHEAYQLKAERDRTVTKTLNARIAQLRDARGYSAAQSDARAYAIAQLAAEESETKFMLRMCGYENNFFETMSERQAFFERDYAERNLSR